MRVGTQVIIQADVNMPTITAGMVGIVASVTSNGPVIAIRMTYDQYSDIKHIVRRSGGWRSGWEEQPDGSKRAQVEWLLLPHQYKMVPKDLTDREKQQIAELKSKAQLSPVEEYTLFGLEE